MNSFPSVAAMIDSFPVCCARPPLLESVSRASGLLCRLEEFDSRIGRQDIILQVYNYPEGKICEA
jgi:hypothetical protein